MANRYMYRNFMSIDQAPVALFMRVTIGATGAPTLDAVNSKGIKSIVRNSAGKYTITLSDNYFRYLGFDPAMLVASGLPAAPVIAVVSQAVSAATPTIVIQCSVGGVATDPASGEELEAVIFLKNSSAP